MTPEERYAAAQARVNAADELRSQRSALEFRVTVEVEGFTNAEPELSAKELRAQVAKLRASVAEWRAVDQKHAALMGRIFGDCEHAGCGEPARWCRGYPKDALLCKQHDEERIAERAR